jgi:hypothetical protein
MKAECASARERMMGVVDRVIDAGWGRLQENRTSAETNGKIIYLESDLTRKCSNHSENNLVK